MGEFSQRGSNSISLNFFWSLSREKIVVIISESLQYHHISRSWCAAGHRVREWQVGDLCSCFLIGDFGWIGELILIPFLLAVTASAVCSLIERVLQVTKTVSSIRELIVGIF